MCNLLWEYAFKLFPEGIIDHISGMQVVDVKELIYLLGVFKNQRETLTLFDRFRN